MSKDKNSPCSKCMALACCGGGCPFDGMKRYNCLTDKRECIITPALIKEAVNDIIKAFNDKDIKLSNGIIEPKT